MRFPLFTSESIQSNHATSLSNPESTIDEDLERFRRLNSREAIIVEKDKQQVSSNQNVTAQQQTHQQPANSQNMEAATQTIAENVQQLMQSIKFPLRKVIIGTRRTTLVLANPQDDSDHSLILSIFNLIILRGAQMDIQPQATEITLKEMFRCLEKSFIDYNPKLKSNKIQSLLLRLYNTGTVDFCVTGSIDGIDNELIDKLLKWVKIYFVHGILISDKDPLFDSLRGMKYCDLTSPSKHKNSKKVKDIQDFLGKHSDLSITEEGLNKLHNTESMRLKVLLHEDIYSVIVNYKGRLFELVDKNMLDKHPNMKRKYEDDSGNIPPSVVWAKWPIHKPNDKRILCGGDFFEISRQGIEEIVLDDPVAQTLCSPADIDPSILTCPISMCLFFDPVVAADNITYEKEVYRKWCSKKTEVVSPVTGRRIAPKFTNDVVIRNKVHLYLDRNIHMKLSEDLYMPKYAFDGFRKSVTNANTDEATLLCKDDIRLIFYKPEELKNINEDIEVEDSLSGYNYAFMFGNTQLLNSMKEILTENLYLAIQQNSTPTVEMLSHHLDMVELKIQDSLECNKVKLQVVENHSQGSIDHTLINA